MPSEIRLRPAREDELAEMVRIGDDAFMNSPVSLALFPVHLRVDGSTRAECEWRLKNSRKVFGQPNKHFIVAIEDLHGAGGDQGHSEQLIGWALWTSPSDAPEEEKSEEQKAKEKAEAEKELPSSLDKEALGNFKTKMDEFTKSVLGERGTKDYWVLNSIAIDPKHQRKGAGSKLARWGITEAGKANRDTWLIANPTGRPLYLSLGFEIIGETQLLGEVQTQMLKRSSVIKDSA